MELPEDAIQYHGPMAIQILLGISGKFIERKLGGRDATLLRGGNESGLWRVERVRLYQLYRDVMPAAIGCPMLYSSVEAAWLVGLYRDAYLAIAPPARAYAVPAGCTERRYPLWAEPMLRYLRKQIALGAIRIRWRSLSRAKAGAVITAARHVMAENQRAESEACRKAQAWSVLT
jgi:hypothetical protein